MDSLSALDAQTIIPSSQTNTGKTAEELAAEDAEQQQIDFLNLLLTQLETQNPLDPMDTDEWTAQLTRYSQLEQQIETNEKLVVTNELLKDSSATAGFSYIGEEVEVATNISVVQDGEAAWSYTVEGDADEVYLTVTDEDGNVVYEGEGNTNAGVHSLVLETETADFEGQQLYLSISALDNEGTHLNTQTTAHMTVDGLWTDDNGQTYLTAGEISFRTTDVLKVVDTNDETQDIEEI